MTINAYKSVKKATLVEGASPHQLIAMLYDGALSNIAIARQHMEAGNRSLLHVHIDKAVAIIQELQGSLLDHETNEISANLYDLYSYLVKTMVASEITMDDEGLINCVNLIGILKEAWHAISPEQIAA